MEVHDPKYLRREQPEGVCKPCSGVYQVQRGIAGWRPEDIMKVRIYTNNFLNKARLHKYQL